MTWSSFSASNTTMKANAIPLLAIFEKKMRPRTTGSGRYKLIFPDT